MVSADRATLFDHGTSGTPENLRTVNGRALPAAARAPGRRARADRDRAGHDRRHRRPEWAPLERELRQLARRQTGCRALMGLYGMGELDVAGPPSASSATSGACRPRARPSGWPASTSGCTARTAAAASASSTAKAHRTCAGRSTKPRWPPAGRAAPTTPTTAALKARGLSHTRASLTIARKLARRSFHVLRQFGPAALEPIRIS